jgi:hypothetical protein
MVDTFFLFNQQAGFSRIQTTKSLCSRNRPEKILLDAEKTSVLFTKISVLLFVALTVQVNQSTLSFRKATGSISCDIVDENGIAREEMIGPIDTTHDAKLKGMTFYRFYTIRHLVRTRGESC